MADLPGGLRGFRFYTGRAIPKGTTLKTTMIGPLVVVEGSVPGGPHVVSACAVSEYMIILDDALFFEHELKPIVGGGVKS